MLHEKEANIVPQTRFQLASMVRYLLLKGNSFFSISVYKHWKEKFFVEYNRFRYWQIWDIFFKSKMRKKKGKHAPFVIPFYGCFHLHGEGVEMREQMSILLLVPTTRDTYTEWRLRGRERKKRKKRFEGIWTWFFREVLRLTSGLLAFRGYRLLSWSGWKPYLIY